MSKLHGTAEATLQRMQGAVQALLLGIGEDVEREGLVDTPRRVAKAWLDMASGSAQESKRAFGTALFHEPIVSAGSEGLVVVRDITFAALHERTLLPFHGRCHVAYLPQQGVVLGLSKLARVAKCLASSVQSQQAFTDALAAAVDAAVAPGGVAVVVQARQLGAGDSCGPLPQLTTAATGGMRHPGCGMLLEFLTLLHAGGGPALSPEGFAAAGEQPPAAVAGSDALAAAGGAGAGMDMAAAVRTLLEAVGECPSRQGLEGSAERYVHWLHSATAGYRMQPLLPASELGLGPATPDDHSLETSDASSDDMAADGPCFVSLREQRQQRGGGGASSSDGTVSPDPGSPPAAAAAAGAAAAGFSGEHGDSSSGRPAVFSARFASSCEHHMLPFYGTLRLAYSLPAGGVAGGLSAADPGEAAVRLQHVVEMYSRRLQVQERLTHQVAQAAEAALGAEAVLVVIESAHMCMVARGVEKHASTTLTTAARGRWAADPAARAAALQVLLSHT